MAYTDVELILDQLEDIKDISSAELSLIEQLSVKMLPDKVVNQSSRLKGAMANPVTASNGISKYINLRITAINQAISEIKSKWNEVIPLSTSDITTLKTRLDTLTMGVNDEYNTLLKIENAIKKEVSDREQAITNLINEASEDFNTLKKIETKVKQEISDREQAITDLINGASSGYDTLKELETAIKKEVSDRSNAITNLINNATTNYNTLGKLETRIKEETANRNSAVSAIKGTATSSNDTLGKIETNLNNEISNRENAIEALINNASDGYQTLKELEDKIKAEVAARTQAITKEISDRNSAIQTAISKLVDTAPDLLNTLNELAEALGNDPNFATTVANNIAQSLTTAKAYTDTKISSEASARDIAISSAISNLKGAATTNYDTLAKLETRIKEEMTNRTNAISDLIGGANESYNTLKELEDAIKAEVTNRTEAISDLIGTATTSYDTLGKIQARIEAISGTEEGGLTIEGAITASMDYTDEKVAEETSARNSAINALKNGASSGYDTLKELETAIKNEATTRASAITQEVSDRNSAITTAINNLKGTAESGYDTLGELQNAITKQKTALENSISQAKTDVKNELLGGAGAAFDTLNELAEALGNDPNFATTVLNKISAIKGTPTSDYDSLEKIENKLKEEVSDREQAITDLINGASSGYDTLKELETAIKKEVSDRSNAITNLINNATTNYNTLGKLETRIKEETANRNSAVSAIKGTATSSNDTLGKIETNLNNEISNRENAIETIYDEVKNNYVDKDTFKNYNLKFSAGYGLVTNEEYYGGKIGFNDEGYPCFVGSFGERTIAVSPSTLVDDYNFYTFPEKNGTLALQEDVDLIKNSLINFKQKTIQVQKSIPARSFYTVTDEFEKKVLIIGVHISALVMDRIFCGMPRCIYESPKIFRFDLYNSSEYETKVSYLSITYIELE